MVTIKHITASVEVDGVALREHQDPSYKGNCNDEAVKYLEVPPSAVFKIRVKFAQIFKPLWRNVSVNLYLDGVFVDNRILDKKPGSIFLECGDRECMFEGRTRYLPNGECWFSPFKFQQLESKILLPQAAIWAHRLPDDGPINWKLTAEEVEKLGRIEIQVHNYNKGELKPCGEYIPRKGIEEKIPKDLLVNTTLTHSIG